MDISFGSKSTIQSIQNNWFGKVIPDFNFISTDGNILKLAQLAGRVLVFNFWFTTCSGCLKEIPELNKLVNQYKKNDNIVFIAPALNDSYTIKSFLKEKQFIYSCVEGADFINKIGISGYPTHLIVGKSGKIIWLEQGVKTNIIDKISNIIEKEINE